MKTLSIFIVLCLSFGIVDKTNSVFGDDYNQTAQYSFMQTNSTAHIYMQFGSTITDNQTKYKGIWDVVKNSPSSDVIVTDTPSVMSNGSTIIDYKITTKENVKGMYGFQLGNCGLDPIIVGLDESEINAPLFVKSFLVALPCPPYNPGDGIEVNQSGFILKNITIIHDKSGNPQISFTTVPEFGPLAIMIVSIGIIGVIMVQKRTRL